MSIDEEMGESEKIGEIIRATAELTPIIEAIALERMEQITREGFSLAHDDEHTDGSLAAVAGCYALAAAAQANEIELKKGVPRMWPGSWDEDWWKPKDQKRNLIRAAALILAELQRLARDEG